MSNPFQQHRSALFSERDSIDAALHYVHQIINTLDGADKAAALTAMMVLVNTAAKLWPEAPAQVAEAPAFDLDSRLEALAARVYDLEHSKPTVTDATVQVIQSQISDWADDNFNNFADDWLRNHADVGQEVETWMENNMDIENEVREVLSSANLSITF